MEEMMKAKPLMLSILLLLLVSPATAQDNEVVIYTGNIEAMPSDADAILVTDVGQLNEYKTELVELAKTKVVLFEGNEREMVETLQLEEAWQEPIPVVETDKTEWLVSGVHNRNGQGIVGGVLYPTGNPPEDSDKSLADYVDKVLTIADRFGPLTPEVPFAEYHVYLPFTKRGPIAKWDPVSILYVFVDNCPFGQYTDLMEGKMADGDGSAVYDYWGVSMEQQIVSGWEGCESNYYSSKVWNKVRLENGAVGYRYGPTTTVGSSSASVNLGISELGMNWSWSFSVLDVEVYDHSKFSENWIDHEFVINGNPAKYTYLGEPGVSMRLEEGMQPLMFRPMNLYWKNWLGTVPFYDNWWIEF
jgi:hypothetical protein